MGILSDDIIKYKRGELNPEQMHALEKKALADPFLAEALEGTENFSPEELAADISAINNKITSKKKNILFTPLRVAAGIVLLIASVFLVYQFVSKPETIALKTEKPKPENKKADEKETAGSGKGTEKVESEKSNAKSEEGEIIKSESIPKTQDTKIKNQNSKDEIKQPVSSNQSQQLAGPKTKIQEPLLQQAPVQDLALTEQQQTKIENADDQKPKEIVEPNKAAGAKSLARSKKK